jgi:hypothetical protein
MQEETRYIKQNDSLRKGRGDQEQIDEEFAREQDLIIETMLDGGPVLGKEGGLRVDMFTHDDPDDLQCICDLPTHAQDIIISESDL